MEQGQDDSIDVDREGVRNGNNDEDDGGKHESDPVQALAKHIALYDEKEWLSYAGIAKWQGLLDKVRMFFSLAGSGFGLAKVDVDRCLTVAYSIPSARCRPGMLYSDTIEAVSIYYHYTLFVLSIMRPKRPLII